MYLDYQTYLSLGGTLPVESFTPREAWAEAQLDNWTLNRLQSVDWSGWSTKVALVMKRLVDDSDSIMEAEGGSPVSHFSNGRDSFTFAEPLMNAPLHACYGYAVDVLPVEIMSACVRYNGAH